MILGTGTEISVLDLAESIQQAININSEISYTDLRPAEIDNSVADISKACEWLGSEPRVLLYDVSSR